MGFTYVWERSFQGLGDMRGRPAGRASFVRVSIPHGYYYYHPAALLG